MLFVHAEQRLKQLLLALTQVFLKVGLSWARKILERTFAVLNFIVFLEFGLCCDTLIILASTSISDIIALDPMVMHLNKMVLSPSFTFRASAATLGVSRLSFVLLRFFERLLHQSWFYLAGLMDILALRRNGRVWRAYSNFFYFWLSWYVLTIRLFHHYDST